MYGRGFERGLDIVIEKERQRKMKIHQMNLHSIRNSDGYYSLKQRQSTELKMQVKKEISLKHQLFRETCKLKL